jgi:hypothetical protein
MTDRETLKEMFERAGCDFYEKGDVLVLVTKGATIHVQFHFDDDGSLYSMKDEDVKELVVEWRPPPKTTTPGTGTSTWR